MFGLPKRTLALVAVLLVLTTGGMAQQFGGGVFDDFNDGNLDEWTTAASYSTSTAQTWEGSHSMYGSGAGAGGTASLSVSEDEYDRISFRARFPSFDDMWTSLRVKDQTQDNVLVNLRAVKSGSGTADLISRSGVGSNTDTGIDLQADTWYSISVYNIDYQAETYDIEVTTQDGSVVGTASGFSFQNGGTANELAVITQDSPIYVDYLTYNGGPVETYELSGEVTDENDNTDIEGATVEAYDQDGALVNNDTTNSIGQYAFNLPNGTYTVYVNKTGYQNENRTVTVDGEDQIQNFKLASFNGSINLRANNYIEHGESTPYSVIVTIDGDRQDVTDTATVTSSNTSVVTVDSQAAELVATSNIQINDRVTITAEYTDQNGNVYVTQQNVTVANETVENIGILPTASRFTASIDDQTIQAILVATGFGAAAALIASSFAGLGATTLIMTIAWLADYVGDGMIIVTVLVALFIGLNMALNIDYTVTKGG